MREAWRLHKHELYPFVPNGYQLHVFLIFTDTELQDYQKIISVVKKGIEKFPEQINK